MLFSDDLEPNMRLCLGMLCIILAIAYAIIIFIPAFMAATDDSAKSDLEGQLIFLGLMSPVLVATFCGVWLLSQITVFKALSFLFVLLLFALVKINQSNL